MASVGKCDEVESKVEESECDVEDRIVKVCKLFDNLQSSWLRRFFVRKEHLRVGRSDLPLLLWSIENLKILKLKLQSFGKI